MAIAIWSLPNKNTFTATQGELRRCASFSQQNLQNCFVLKPYQSNATFYSIGTKNAHVLNESKTWLKEHLNTPKAINSVLNLPDYIQKVGQAVNALKQEGDFEKVVFSRCKDVAIDGFNFLWLDALRAAYPNAFISLVQDQNLGTWITASPELFLYRKADFFKSFSLAGTKHGKDSDLGKKEEKEQQIVTDFISNAFEQNGLIAEVKKGVEHKAGALTHLLTVLQGNVKDASFSLDNLIEDLHPTPAVGGSPKSKALSFLQQEGYNRELYTGFFGPSENHENFEFYVNLRCAQIFDNAVRFYAGAGITEGSVPSKEFIETEAKMAVLQSVIII